MERNPFSRAWSSDWRDPHGPREAELPADLTARRRALVLGFPAETFVLTAEEVKAVAERLGYPWPNDTREPRDD